jgi:uncharacterized cofD-like protein
MAKTKITVIGGGTGTVAVLAGLKKYEDVELSVIVCMTDDGGSNRIVRDEFGLLPLSDLRKSIVALSSTGNGILRNLFTYRFDKGEGLAGHTLGNLIMMALSDITGSEKGAIEKASKLFNVVGKIIPVTYDDVRLSAEYDDGRIVKGEHNIDEPTVNPDAKIVKLFLNPSAKANSDAVSAIMDADYLVVGPGDLYTSTLPNVIVDGIADAVCQTQAKYILVSNLMTRKGQTHWMKQSDLVAEVTKYIKRQPDYVVLNNKAIPEAVLQKYTDSGEYPIVDNLNNDVSYKIIRDDVLNDEVMERDSGDVLFRSLIRHSQEQLAKVIYNIINNNE